MGVQSRSRGLRVVPSALPGPRLSVVRRRRLAVDGVADLAFQGAERFFAGLAFGEFASVVGTPVGVVRDLGDGCDVERAVELPVAARVEPVTVLERAGRLNRSRAVVAGVVPASAKRVTSPV